MSVIACTRCGNTFNATKPMETCPGCLQRIGEEAAMLALMRAVAETVAEAGELGAPESAILRALQQALPSVDAARMEGMLRPMLLVGIFERHNHCLWLGPQGARFVAKVRA